MYMSYCRFEGTLHEFIACKNDVMEHLQGEAEYKVSDEEIRNFRHLVDRMVEFLVYDTCLINEDGELDEDQLDLVCEAMSREYSEDMDESEW